MTAPRFAAFSRWMVFALVTSVCSAGVAAGLTSRVGPYELEVVVKGSPARSFFHAGETYVLGHQGDRYTLRIRNHSGQRVEVVASVDGRDVMDGKPGDYVNKRGYLVPARGQVEIDGWRVSTAEVAAFRFASVADSYAARTGSSRDVGVIGVAVFPEREIQRRVAVAAPMAKKAEASPSKDTSLMDDAPRAASEPEAATGMGAPSGGAAPAPAPAPSAPSAAESSKASAAPSSRGALAQKPTSRPGLGTEFGEAVGSQVETVVFARANATAPAAILGVRYNDRAGLIALGIAVDPPMNEAEMRRTAQPFPASNYAAPPPGWKH